MYWIASRCSYNPTTRFWLNGRATMLLYPILSWISSLYPPCPVFSGERDDDGKKRNRMNAECGEAPAIGDVMCNNPTLPPRQMGSTATTAIEVAILLRET